MLSKVDIEMLEVAEGPRAASCQHGRFVTAAGELAQIVNAPDQFGFLAYIDFKEDAALPRGNHYHKNKDEYLYIIHGRLRAVYEDVETGSVVETIVGTGDLIHVRPNCAHVYVALEYSQALEFSSAIYDPTDTHRYMVEMGPARA